MIKTPQFKSLDMTYAQDIAVKQQESLKEENKQEQNQPFTQPHSQTSQPDMRYALRGSFFYSKSDFRGRGNTRNSIQDLSKQISQQAKRKGKNVTIDQLSFQKTNSQIFKNQDIRSQNILTRQKTNKNSEQAKTALKLDRNECIQSDGNKVFLRQLVGNLIKSSNFQLKEAIDEINEDEIKYDQTESEECEELINLDEYDDLEIKESIEETGSSKSEIYQIFSKNSSNRTSQS